MENKKIFNVKIILGFMEEKMKKIAFSGIDNLKKFMEFDEKVNLAPKNEEEAKELFELQEERGRIEGQMEAYREMFEFITTLPLQDIPTHEA